MELVFIYFGLINLFSFILFGFDKFCAKVNFRRISEHTLFFIQIIGGCYGAFLGMHLFHHKVRKKKFILLNFISLIIYSGLFYVIWRYL